MCLLLRAPLGSCFLMYKVYSKHNASYFIMLAHNVRSECWWYGSRGWTFPPISYSRWQQRGSLTKWCLTWKGMWSKGVGLNSSKWGKLHPLNVSGDQNVNVSPVSRWVMHFSSGDSDMRDKPCSGQPCRFLWAQHAGSCSLLVKMHS